MTNNDDFDMNLDLDEADAVEGFADDAEFQDEGDQPAKTKKSGGGFIKILLVLVVVVAGLFAGVKYLGVQLPFDVPFLSQAEDVQTPVPAQQTAQSGQQDTAAVDMPDVVSADQTDGTGDVVGWADTAAGAEGTAATDSDMLKMMGADTAVETGTDEFGLPPTTEGATDLSMPVGENGMVEPANGALDAIAVWGDTPETQQDMPAADNMSADPFGDVPMVDVPDTPIVTSPVPAQEQLSATMEAPVVAGADAKTVANLEERIEVLEQTLTDLKKATATKADIDALKASLTKIEKAVATAPKSVSRPDADPTLAKPAPVASKKQPAVQKSWVLRSAKPGLAWISEKGSAEIKTISVGDTVSGIGKVTAIAKDEGGRWVVNGTQGKINQ